MSVLILVLSSLAAWDTPAPEYEFVPDTNRWVLMVQGERMSLGKLDSAGNYLPDGRYVSLGGGSLPDHTVLNGRAVSPVYEYRSGRLILGEIDGFGNFVPKLDSKIIDFKEYKPGEGVPAIYNLPGKFVKKGTKDDKK
jgi:hypothetical protein